LGMMLLLLLGTGLINANVFRSNADKNCENPCMVCQKAIYKLKFQKQADCGFSACKTTCSRVWGLWNRPKSPFAGFRADTLGKCDSCFRAGFCSISECSAQRQMEKTVIDQIVNKAKLSGSVDSNAMTKMLKKVMKNKPVNFKKYSNKIKKQIKKNTKVKNFKKNFKKISNALQALTKVSSTKDLKAALAKLNVTVKKAKASKTVKESVRKLADNFKNLIESKRTSKNKKKKCEENR